MYVLLCIAECARMIPLVFVGEFHLPNNAALPGVEIGMRPTAPHWRSTHPREHRWVQTRMLFKQRGCWARNWQLRQLTIIHGICTALSRTSRVLKDRTRCLAQCRTTSSGQSFKIYYNFFFFALFTGFNSCFDFASKIVGWTWTLLMKHALWCNPAARFLLSSFYFEALIYWCVSLILAVTCNSLTMISSGSVYCCIISNWRA